MLDFLTGLPARTPRTASLTLACSIAWSVTWLVGCAADDDAGATCLPELPRDCTPQYAPTFEAIFENRLAVTCGSPQTGGSCHGPAGAQAGLVLSTPEDAYARLLGDFDGNARVIPGDPECSPLMKRLESSDPSTVMPPMSPLGEAERCSILLWIDRGAER